MNKHEIKASIENYAKQLENIDNKLLEYLEKRKIVYKMLKKISKKGIDINLIDFNNKRLRSLVKNTKYFKKLQVINIYNNLNKNMN